jgi:hypothetical protein
VLCGCTAASRLPLPQLMEVRSIEVRSSRCWAWPKPTTADPRWTASRNRGQRLFNGTGPVHKQGEQAWLACQEACASGVHKAVAAARGRLHDALLAWHLELHDRRASEDEEHAEQVGGAWTTPGALQAA